MKIQNATPENLPEILALQKLAYESEARLYNDWSLPALTQSLESITSEFADSHFLIAIIDERIVGSVRGKVRNKTCEIGRLVVHPDFQKRGIGSSLLSEIENTYSSVDTFELFTGSQSDQNIRLYQRFGYMIGESVAVSDTVSIIFLRKPAIPALL